MMTTEQITIFLLLAAVLLLFIWGRWRYDLVAVMALLAGVMLGLVPPDEAFYGFAHPAVITVAAVLIVSRGLINSGMVDGVVKLMERAGDHQMLQLASLVIAVTFCSAFMNNVGALALFMPVAIRMARKNDRSPSVFLMPLAFGSLLGGLITQVGTPPNIIISAFRGENLEMEAFRMFDFAPVGGGIALVGVAFILLFGWRLIPQRKGKLSREELFQIENYITEVKVLKDSKFAGKKFGDLEKSIDGDVMVVGHVRDEQKFPAPSTYRILKPGDSLIIKASADDVQELIDKAGLELVGSDKITEDDIRSEEIAIVEATVLSNSVLEKNTARSMRLRTRYGINLLGVARNGGRLKERPEVIRFKAGDVLLLQGGEDTIYEVLPSLGGLPLAERGLRIGMIKRIFLGLGIFILALLTAAMGLLPIQIAFSAAALMLILAKFVSLKEIYDSIDWPIIVLLGAMIPVSQALETTGGAQILAGLILELSGNMAAFYTLGVILLVTMALSNVVNNAAAALLMAPIAISIGQGMNASLDSFLMCVAVGASCAFLTPIGHQSNTLVMGPGGYQFNDYWKMGLPLSVCVALVAVPLILYFWPLGI